MYDEGENAEHDLFESQHLYFQIFIPETVFYIKLQENSTYSNRSGNKNTSLMPIINL